MFAFASLLIPMAGRFSCMSSAPRFVGRECGRIDGHMGRL